MACFKLTSHTLKTPPISFTLPHTSYQLLRLSGFPSDTSCGLCLQLQKRRYHGYDVSNLVQCNLDVYW
ncbi:hypothetical protein MUK42_30031 [Musa troglodytarum]|uniref:Uncharacterized protein n=1 Tax=Musa troglodytarum TaxID=320322 RepID=A0A9E7GE23_9LILI|nr:hypothetical protein MUK42_30031 [Musa troglodytarum]